MNAVHKFPLPAFDLEAVRADFPILREKVRGKRLVFLDSAASAQKPQAVLDSLTGVYGHRYANIHRGIYHLSMQATEAFEEAREKVRALLNAPDAREVIFTRNATEGINLVAQSYGRAFLQAGDEVVITHMEHHANIVPWQMLRDEKGIVLKVAPITDTGEVDLAAFAACLNGRTKLVAFPHVSNVLGTVNPVRAMADLAHEAGAVVLVDGCQAVPHGAVDVQGLGADFYVFSSHKLYGPSGVGVLWGRTELLERMPPWMGGGEMIRHVTFEKTTYADLPHKFEAGTPAIAEVIALGAAIDYVNGLGWEAIAAHEHELRVAAETALAEIPGLRVIGTARVKEAVFSFVLEGIHPSDVGMILDREGIAVRAGHHCAYPLMERFGVPATARASLGLYNGVDDIEALVAGLHKVRKIAG